MNLKIHLRSENQTLRTVGCRICERRQRKNCRREEAASECHYLILISNELQGWLMNEGSNTVMKGNRKRVKARKMESL